jgi:hypothetical protein
MNLKTALVFAFLVSLVVAKPQISFGEEEEAQPPVPVELQEPTPLDSSVSDNDLVHTRLGLLAGYLSKLQFILICQKIAIDMYNYIHIMYIRMCTQHFKIDILCIDLEAVPGSAPIGEQKKDPALKPNPYIPEADVAGKQSGQCLCVPVGKCANPAPGNIPLPPPGSGPLPPPPIPGHSSQNLSPAPLPNNVPPVNTDGAGLIDVRIVNKVSSEYKFNVRKNRFIICIIFHVQPPAGVRCQNSFQYCCVGNNAFPNAPPAPVQGSCGRSNIIPTPGYNLDPTQV